MPLQQIRFMHYAWVSSNRNLFDFIPFLSLVSSSPTLELTIFPWLKWHTPSTPVNYAAKQFTFPSGVMRTILLFIRAHLIFVAKKCGQIISQEETTNKINGRMNKPSIQWKDRVLRCVQKLNITFISCNHGSWIIWKIVHCNRNHKSNMLIVCLVFINYYKVEIRFNGNRKR